MRISDWSSDVCSSDLPIASFYPSPGGSSEYVHIFCGRTDSTGIGGLHGNTSEDEDIRAFVESFEAAYERLRTGGIVNSISVVALQWLALNRNDLSPSCTCTPRSEELREGKTRYSTVK